MRKLVVVCTAIAVAIIPASFLSQAQAADSYDVTLTSNRTSLDNGSTVTFTGKVSPKAAGQQLKVQYFSTDQDGDLWKDALHIERITITSNGTYSGTFTPYEGERLWRVYKPSGQGVGSGFSSPVTLKVYEWWKLTGPSSLSEHMYIQNGAGQIDKYGTIPVAGTPVSRYYASNDDGSGTTRWYLDRRCKQVRFDAGLADVSAGTSSQLRVYTHGDQPFISQKVTKGQKISVDKTFSQSASPWIKFTSENRQDLPTITVASNPRVYCAFLANLG